MIKCNYCDTLNEEGRVYCKSCGNILDYDDEEDVAFNQEEEELQNLLQGYEGNIVLSNLKIIGEGLKNPLALIRNCRWASGITTLVMVALTIIISLISKSALTGNGTFNLLSNVSSDLGYVNSFKTWHILAIEAILLLVNIVVLFILLLITGESPNILDCVNIIIFSNFLVTLLFLIGTIIAKISLILGALIFLLTSVLYYLMLFVALNEGLEVTEGKSIFIMITNSVVTIIVMIGIFKLLMKIMFKAMY